MKSKADSLVRHNKADNSLVSYMPHASNGGAQQTRIVSDDTDMFVLLLYWPWKANVMEEIQIQKWDGDILKSTASGTKCEGLLDVHALS